MISIIVPVYNTEEYLRECIESLLNQTYSDIEIIIVDDGSTDNSGKICDWYMMKDQRVRVIHKKNGGLVSARKAGLEIAKGEYIAFVDSDDYVEQNMYENMIKKISGADFIHTGYFRNDAKIINFKKNELNINETERTMLIKDLLAGHGTLYISPSIWSKLFSKDLILYSYSMVDDNCSYGEDVLTLIAAISKAKKIVFEPVAYYHYRVRDTSLAHEKSKSLQKGIKLFNAVEKLVSKLYDSQEIENSMNLFCMEQVVWELRKGDNPFLIEQYNFPSPERVTGKHVLIYGAGNVGKNYYSQFCRKRDIDVIGFVDQNYKKIYIDGVNIYPIDYIEKLDYDYLIVAVDNERYFNNILEDIKKFEISSEKIIWEKPINYLSARG